MNFRLLLTALAVSLFSANAAVPHEFWIEPAEYQVETGVPVLADFRNGQEFKGSAQAYFDKRTDRLDIVLNGKVEPFQGRMGDVPAVQTTATEEGLMIIVHQTAPSTLKYTVWDKFQAFADHKDFPDIQARHKARGLPETGFTERYTRFVKALIAVGHGRGADFQSGMETEFVALANPYTDDLDNGLPVELLYMGQPRADAQVEVFDRAPDGNVSITLLRTDPAGRVAIPVRSGHSYLLDAVVLRPMPEGSVEVWESLWAGMTFARP